MALLRPRHRALASPPLAQRIALPGGLPGALSRSPAADGSLFVAVAPAGGEGSGAGGSSIVRLAPVPFLEQAAQALGLGEHEEGLALARLAPPAQVCG